MSKRRLISFGCSHAFGSEIYERGDTIHLDNFKLSFGNLIAEKNGLDFYMAARPGNSNQQILNDVIEHAETGDICLLSWTYADRDTYINVGNDSPDENFNFSLFHVMSVLYKSGFYGSIKILLDRFSFLKDKDDERSNIDSDHKMIVNYENTDIQNFCKGYVNYNGSSDMRTINFLKTYYYTNKIIMEKGAVAINFHYDIEPEIIVNLSDIDKLTTSYIYPKSSYSSFTPYYNEVSDKMLINKGTASNTKLYDFYENDKSRLDFEINSEKTSYKKWYMNKFYPEVSIHGWPKDRMGHLDGNGHELLANILQERIEEILDAN